MLSPVDITHIRIERPGKSPIVLERIANIPESVPPATPAGTNAAEGGKMTNNASPTSQEDTWRLVAPLEARANRFNVDALLRLAKAKREAEIPFDPADLAKYGLDKPHATVWLNDTQIRFGEGHPLKDQYYVHCGSGVYLVDGRYFRPVAYPYSNYIDTRLIETGRRPVAFRFPHFSLTLKDGVWNREPEENNLTTDRVNEFVQEWERARALSVERYSGKPVRARIRVMLKDRGRQKELTLGILAREPEFILLRADERLEYHFPEGAARRLLDLSAR